MQRLLVLALGLVWCAWALALSPGKPVGQYARVEWNTERGLPHDIVHSVAQSDDGYLWFATWEGLARFNGSHFRVFDRHTVSALRGNGIRSLLVTRDGTLWLGTFRDGLVRHARGEWRTYTTADGLGSNKIIALAEDSQGRLWVGHQDGGLSLLQRNGRFNHFDLDDGLASRSVLALEADGQGRLWIGTGAGLNVLDDKGLRPFESDALPPNALFPALLAEADGSILVGSERGLYRISADRIEPAHEDRRLRRAYVSALLRDRDGALWVGTAEQGLFRIDELGVEQFASTHGLSNDRVTTLFEDREGTLWIGTNGGLEQFHDGAIASFGTAQGLTDNFVRNVLQDANGRLWVGTSRGLNVLEGPGFRPVEIGVSSESVLSLANDPSDGVWVGTYGAGLVRLGNGSTEVLDRTSGLRSNQIRALVFDRQGRMWVGSPLGLQRRESDGRWTVFGVEQGLPNNFVFALHVDARDRVWVGTSDGMARIENDEVTSYTRQDGFPANSVYGLVEDGDLHWIASDNGLLRMRGESVRALNMGDGLPVDTLLSLLDDGRGQLWACTPRGLLRFRKDDISAHLESGSGTLPVDSYGRADGMASAQCNGGSQPSAWQDREGAMWFATAQGVARIHPDHSAHSYQSPPPVVIESVSIDQQELAVASALRIPAGARSYEIGYAGLSALVPEKVRYRYRLDGFDPDWVHAGREQVARYTNLWPGTYVFRVAASNTSGLWSAQEGRLELVIEPLWWQRPLAWVGAALLLLLVFVLAIRWRMHRLAERERELAKLVNLRTADLSEKTRMLEQANQENLHLLDQLAEQSEAFARQAREDALTGIANRRDFDQQLRQAWTAARKHGAPLALAVLDVDHFKRVNDEHSHQVGDEVLRHIAQTLKAACRAGETCARLGGEEFVLLMPGLDLAAALRRCEQIREDIAASDLSGLAPGLRVTVSVGASVDTDADSPDRLLADADRRLYEAKRAGRNRVCPAAAESVRG